MLNIVDYARFMEKIRTHMPPIINPPSSSSYCSNSYTSTSTTSTSFESSFLHSNFNPKHCDIDKFLITSKDNEEIVKMAENTEGSKRLQQKAFEDKQFRQKIIDMLLCSDKILAHLAMDNNANFLIQKLVELEMDNSMPGPLVQSIKKMSLDLALNRYGCRVIQKLFNYLPSKNVQDLLSEQFKGHEFQLITDQNGNHIIQFVVNHFHPEVYAAFMQSLIDSIGIQQIIENKYGCRVVQAALERVISECQKDHEQYLEKTTAKELLRILIFPIIQNAYDFAKNEFANYIVQVILKSDYLSEQRKHIIKESLMHNLFILSQGKFSSHVVEVALEHADDNCLEAMFLEILEGYEPDGSGRTALDFMLFNQFGNYVVQRMLEISVDIRDGKRKGNQKWMDEIISRALFVQHQLSRYSSGKKILDMIQVHVLPHHQFIVPNPYLPNAFRHEPFFQPQPNPMGWNLGMIAANPLQQFYFPPNPFFY